MIGYKGFNYDLTCIGLRYEIGKTYTINDENTIELCRCGYHFCRYPTDVLKYYNGVNDRYALIHATEKIIDGYDKSVTSQITIVKLLTKEELYQLMPHKLTRINGTQEWYEEGKLYREDGPAIVDSDGTQKWYKKGRLHREDGPATEYSDGTQEWYKEGLLHREDGPAVECSDGTKEWYKEGRLHRECGPAKEYPSGAEKWYKNGFLHREDGPAIVNFDGTKHWYKEGRWVILDYWNKMTLL